jgi:hypothetical protein
MNNRKEYFMNLLPFKGKLKKGQLIWINWKDDSSNRGTSDDGSYNGPAKFVRHVRKGQVGDEMLEKEPHIVVKIDEEDHGSFFPRSAVFEVGNKKE